MFKTITKVKLDDTVKMWFSLLRDVWNSQIMFTDEVMHYLYLPVIQTENKLYRESQKRTLTLSNNIMTDFSPLIISKNVYMLMNESLASCIHLHLFMREFAS